MTRLENIILTVKGTPEITAISEAEFKGKNIYHTRLCFLEY